MTLLALHTFTDGSRIAVINGRYYDVTPPRPAQSDAVPLPAAASARAETAAQRGLSAPPRGRPDTQPPGGRVGL